MPFLRPHTAADGGDHPQAFWTPAFVGLDLHSEQANVTYAGYHDAAHWASGGPPIAGAARQYPLSGPACRELFRRLLAIPGVTELLEALPLASGDFAGAPQVPFPTPPPPE